MKNILIIEDDVVFSRSISNWLKKKGMATSHVATLSAARKELQAKEFDLVLADLRLPDGSSMELLKWMKGKHYSIPFLIMTSYGQVENAVEAMQLGASNYLCKPVHPDRLWKVIEKEFSRPQHGSTEFYRGESEKAREMYRLIGPVARSDMSVLLRGASGTGKEHIAAEIHERSLRRHKPFVAVDCGAVSDDLVRSEFFGYCKGAFTGADSDKAGLFQAAEGGTLFLDEIGNLAPVNQMKLLRALQEKRYLPVGTVRERPFDIRLIAATNADLEKAVAEGSFREDLYHRINEFTIRIPDLKERKEDLLLFANHFLDLANSELQKDIIGFDNDTMQLFQSYSWPGNLRQMKNVIKYATLLATGRYITRKELPEELTENLSSHTNIQLKNVEHERDLIRKALQECGNNKTRAAQLLGIDRKTLYNKLKIYQLD